MEELGCTELNSAVVHSLSLSLCLCARRSTGKTWPITRFPHRTSHERCSGSARRTGVNPSFSRWVPAWAWDFPVFSGDPSCHGVTHGPASRFCFRRAVSGSLQGGHLRGQALRHDRVGCADASPGDLGRGPGKDHGHSAEPRRCCSGQVVDLDLLHAIPAHVHGHRTADPPGRLVAKTEALEGSQGDSSSAELAPTSWHSTLPPRPSFSGSGGQSKALQGRKRKAGSQRSAEAEERERTAREAELEAARRAALLASDQELQVRLPSGCRDLSYRITGCLSVWLVRCCDVAACRGHGR